MKTLSLSRQDAYAFSRALVGYPWIDLPVSPLVYALLTRLDLKRPDEMAIFRQILSPDLLRQVVAANPLEEPPGGKEEDALIVPELPQGAWLTPDQERAATTVGLWLKDYVQWAGRSANETPLLFHEGVGLYLAAVAIGRRLHIHTP